MISLGSPHARCTPWGVLYVRGARRNRLGPTPMGVELNGSRHVPRTASGCSTHPRRPLRGRRGRRKARTRSRRGLRSRCRNAASAPEGGAVLLTTGGGRRGFVAKFYVQRHAPWDECVPVGVVTESGKATALTHFGSLPRFSPCLSRDRGLGVGRQALI